MKKILLLIAVTICAAQAFSANTATITLNGTDYTSIANAMAASTSSSDIINISAGTVYERVTLAKPLTIKGAGIGVSFIEPATFPSPVVYTGSAPSFSTATTISIADLTIQNGNYNFGGGGMSFSNTGAGLLTINLTNLKVSSNTTSSTNGGGGILVTGRVAITITGCNITGNTSAGNGAGIYVNPGATYEANVTIKNSTISNNTSSAGNGAGIAVVCGNNGSTAVTNNLSIENSTIYGNTLSGSAKIGGGIDYKCAASSQAVTPVNNMTLNHCSIVNNTTTAGTGADGVCVENWGTGYKVNLTMNNSIIMGNSGSTSNASQIGLNGSSVTANDKYNITSPYGITNSIFGIIASGTWVTTANNNKLDAVIGDLAFASSLSTDVTPVLVIGSTSIAKNYVTTNAISLIKDELGNKRDTKPDAGAYELPLVIAATPGTGGVVTSGAGNYYTGSSATLIATPSSGYDFINWTENGSEVSTSASYNFTISGDRTLVANFDLSTGIKTNVATNQFVVAKESIISNVSGSIQIYSISGKMIKNQTIAVGQVIPMTAGSYIVRVVTNNEVFVQKISF